MRFAFGLASLLVCIGIIVMLMNMELSHDKGVLHANKVAREEATQISGIGAAESVTLKPISMNNSGHTDALLVKVIAVGGPIEKYYGLKKGDKIIEIGPQRVRDWNDDELAEAEVIETYQRSGHIVVDRDGQQITLPAAPGAVTAGATSGSGNSGSTNTDAAADPLKTLQSIPTH